MFKEFEGLLQKTAPGDINAIDPSELQQHVQTAADAQQTGNDGLAQQLSALVQQYQSNPEGLKNGIVSLIGNKPEILQQFAPQFAQTILGSL